MCAQARWIFCTRRFVLVAYANPQAILMSMSSLRNTFPIPNSPLSLWRGELRPVFSTGYWPNICWLRDIDEHFHRQPDEQRLCFSNVNDDLAHANVESFAWG